MKITNQGNVLFKKYFSLLYLHGKIYLESAIDIKENDRLKKGKEGTI